MKFAEKSVLVPFEKYQRLINCTEGTKLPDDSRTCPPSTNPKTKEEPEKQQGGKTVSEITTENSPEETTPSRPPPPGVPIDPPKRSLYPEDEPKTGSGAARSKKIRSWSSAWKVLKR